MEALSFAGNALERNFQVWNKANNLENWCKAMTALGDVSWRLSQFDAKEKFFAHIARAKSYYEAVRNNCSEVVLKYYYAISERRLANIYSDREFSASEKEFYSNLEMGLRLYDSSLKLTSKSASPVDWGDITTQYRTIIYSTF